MTRPDTMALYLSMAAYVANALQIANRLALETDEPPFELVELADYLDAAGDRVGPLVAGSGIHEPA